jgi:RNA polymerase sigma-70 factor (ECF subfamily)
VKPNAVKALLHRARAALDRARGGADCDPVADRAVVERFTRAISARDFDALSALLAEDAWGVTDGGGALRVTTKPVFGRRAVSRLWAAAGRRYPGALDCRVIAINGEPAALITLPEAEATLAAVHVETRAGAISALRVIRDPAKLRYLEVIS